MVAKWIAMGVGVAFLVFVAVFMGAGLRGTEPTQSAGVISGPAAMVSEQLSDGLIEAQVFSPGNREIRLEVQFMPNSESTVPAGMQPEVIFVMATMNMDGFGPALLAWFDPVRPYLALVGIVMMAVAAARARQSFRSSRGTSPIAAAYETLVSTPDDTGKARSHESSALDEPLCKMHCLGLAVAPLRAQPNENGLSLPFGPRVIEHWQPPSRPGAPPRRPPKILV